MNIEIGALSFVYIVGAASGPQKIGVANNPEERRSVLQVASLTDLLAVHQVSMPRKTAFLVERHAHWLLRGRRVRGEWFNVSPQEAIIAVNDGCKAVARGEGHSQRQPGGKVGRKKQFEERITLPLSASMLAAIDALLSDNEARLDMIREAIEREIKRRERSKPKG
ncbi:GIY-YIG nuclease family protein [Mesorhizobium mediterraneum]|uniref:GIY-YIG nuclease family protein n=1 Tax=Mesorhizobium mediterraneum TaxID=43617 RepID=A0AB36R7S6_9HYPH|nr:GIY-YIG nuclease family protein [Mesorhizobium mediterraneum]PAQ00891.1 hypothetical protein CIT25_17645 [Mesorhizobium mediterraneum]WIW52353.1 GIY-YIG nuclease family protein [Mesorhizobium mediterraneum]